MSRRRCCRTPALFLDAPPRAPLLVAAEGRAGDGPRHLVVHPENQDPKGQGAPLATPGWAAWAMRFAPLVALEGETGLVLEATGLAHLQGGEAELLEQVQGGFAAAGMPVRALLGRSPVALAALLRAGLPSGVLPPAEEARLVGQLPLAALALPPDTIAALERLGLRDVAALERQPRGPLARRFGQALLRELEALRGAPRPIAPLRPPPRHVAAREFLSPLCTAPALERALGLLLAELCAGLLAEGVGARGLLLRAARVDGSVQRLRQGIGRASRDPAHLQRLLAARVEELRPEEGFERIALRAHPVEALPPAQAELGGGAGGEALAALLDRIGQRLELWRLAPGDSHWPERAVRRVSPHAGAPATAPRPPPRGTPRCASGGTSGGGSGGTPGGAPAITPGGAPGPLPGDDAWPTGPARPLRLLRRPIPVEAVALLPDAPPSLLRLGRGRVERVVAAEGPERILPEWWREGRMPPGRDYYRLQLASGPRLWVCRSGAPGEAGARWFVHGYLP